MPADRALWADSFRDQLPHWPCPKCKKGHFSAMEGKLLFEETGPSKADHGHDAWEPEWIKQRFACFMECTLPNCREVAVATGSSKINHWQVDWDEYVSEDILTVEAVTPAPVPILFPNQTPIEIVDAIERGAALIWLSAEAAANAIRQAVEHFMDDAGIAATDGAGKRIMLHNRILEFQKGDAENGDVLLATKWLGNTGSHIGGLTRDHVLDAFDMMELVLNNRYGTAKADLLAKVAAVNAAKGPPAAPPG